MSQEIRRVAKVEILPNGNLADARDELYSRVFAHTFDKQEACRAIMLKPGRRGNYQDTGRDYLRWRPHINERIKVLIAEKAQDLCIDENWVILQLVETLQKAKADKEKLNMEGEGTGVYEFDGRTTTKVLEMIGGNIGMFEKNKQAAMGGVTINMQFGGDVPALKISDGKRVIEGEKE
jgi:hypothetical protein